MIRKFTEFPYPDPNCRTCGGDGFVPSSCGGTTDFQTLATRIMDPSSHGFYNGREVRHTPPANQFDTGAVSVGKLFCTKCNNILFEGHPYELSSMTSASGNLRYVDTNEVLTCSFYDSLIYELHPFYSTLGEHLARRSSYYTGAGTSHTVDRCPDCMGETYTCTACRGEPSRKNVGSITDPSYPCSGTYALYRVTYNTSHSITNPEAAYSASQAGFPYTAATHTEIFDVYEIRCTNELCGNVVARRRASDMYNLGGTNEIMYCPDHTYMSPYPPTSYPPTYQRDHIFLGYNNEYNNYNNENILSIKRVDNINEYTEDKSKLGAACTVKHNSCQYCYYGGQTEKIICGCDTYNYYDANKNITPDICDKVVKNILPIK